MEISNITAELAKLDRDTYSPELFKVCEDLVAVLKQFQELTSQEPNQNDREMAQYVLNINVDGVVSYIRTLLENPSIEAQVISVLTKTLKKFQEGLSDMVDEEDTSTPPDDAGPALLPEIPADGIGFENREGDVAEGAPTTRYAFSADSPPIKIGGASTCHIRTEGYRMGSLVAYVQRQDDRSYKIVDMGSGTGTFVNGEKVNTSALRDGTKICIGNTTLWVCIPE